MQDDIKAEVLLVGHYFKELIDKYNRMQTKKRLYKDIKDLTIIDIKTIIVIGKDMRSMSEVASSLDVTSGTSTVAIDRLIAKGYVERIRDLEDRRQVFVKLSADGVKVYETAEEVKNEVIERVFGVLSPEERKVTIDIFKKINNQFSELFPEENCKK
ncbi:MarR family winged helix-turn-helix transcriptional regulator [Acetivibrio cellulolyticus]|uniref:MarR family winged helix-turn-helix transcriptional regulator n=1 Tax=Acetivibrio cellulolyticus TaxID=35830 RepID=UPI0001E2D4F5|nr:MarR family transcriptional regulator [Acetivibrio cellulolyticus]